MKNILDQLYWGELDQCNREQKQDEALERAMQSVYEISDCLLGRAERGGKAAPGGAAPSLYGCNRPFLSGFLQRRIPPV